MEPWTLYGMGPFTRCTLSRSISYDFTGRSVSNAGDVNGDGYDDLIIGAPFISTCYVLFGNVRGFMNMTDGFMIKGVSLNDLTGLSVNSAGIYTLLVVCLQCVYLSCFR